MGDRKPGYRRRGPGAGSQVEMRSLSDKRDIVLMLEELERRLETQRVPLGVLAECRTQAEGCYADTCDSFCEHCVQNVGCQDHCYCLGMWCVENCYPVECGQYCALCTDDGSSMY